MARSARRASRRASAVADEGSPASRRGSVRVGVLPAKPNQTRGITAFSILLGAELNAAIEQQAGRGRMRKNDG